MHSNYRSNYFRRQRCAPPPKKTLNKSFAISIIVGLLQRYIGLSSQLPYSVDGVDCDGWFSPFLQNNWKGSHPYTNVIVRHSNPASSWLRYVYEATRGLLVNQKNR